MNSTPLLFHAGVASIVIQSLLTPGAIGAAAEPNQQSGFIRSEFIYVQAPFPSCHASTVVETKTGLLAAWFGGTSESNPDVGIWTSRRNGQSWSAPLEAANGIQPDGKKRFPCWNPVLFQPENGPLLLFYTAVIQSGDGLVHITYTWKRQRIKHAMVDPQKLALRPIHRGQWPN